MIEQYFQSLLELLVSLPFVVSPGVNLEKRGELIGFIRGEVVFSNDSILFFRELIDLRFPLRTVSMRIIIKLRKESLYFGMIVPLIINRFQHFQIINI